LFLICLCTLLNVVEMQVLLAVLDAEGRELMFSQRKQLVMAMNSKGALSAAETGSDSSGVGGEHVLLAPQVTGSYQDVVPHLRKSGNTRECISEGWVVQYANGRRFKIVNSKVCCS
jgi:hypothetical protein